MSDNITNSTDYVEASNKSADSTNIIDITVFVFGAISALIGMIILNMNTPLIKLNRIMKTILNVLLAHTILLFVIPTLTLVSSNRDVFVCGFMSFISATLGYSVLDHFALFSYMRFHLISKKAENQSPDERFLFGITSLVYFTDYVFNILMTTVLDTNYEYACLEEQASNKDPIEYLLHGIKIVIFIGIGLNFDNKYIKILKTNHQRITSEFVIPVKTSWAPLAVCSIFVVFAAIFSHGGTFTFTLANIISLIPTILLLITILALTYQEIKKHEDQGGEDEVEAQDPQSYTHLRQVNLEKRRVQRNSITEDIVAQQLQDVCEILTVDRILDHTLAQEPQAFGIKGPSGKKTTQTNQINKVGSKKGEKNHQKPNAKKIQVLADIHRELPDTRVKPCTPGGLAQANLPIDNPNDQEDNAEENDTTLNDDELIEQEMIHFNLSNRTKDTLDPTDIPKNETDLDVMIEEELVNYNLTERKLDDKMENETNSWDAESVEENETPNVIVNQTTLLENQQRDARSVLSFGKSLDSLDSDIFEFFADLEGSVPIKKYLCKILKLE